HLVVVRIGSDLIPCYLGSSLSAFSRLPLHAALPISLVFYTIDGRRSGYSIGASMTQVAQRLIELGCVSALCLDGGGSTTISVTQDRKSTRRNSSNVSSAYDVFWMKKIKVNDIYDNES